MIDYNLLQKLCTATGISGDENCVREIIIDEIKSFTDSIIVDNLGNVLVKKKGKKRSDVKLMLSAHMDEVGLMVTDITSEGYLKCDEVGGIDKRVLLGQNVIIGKNKVNGVIGIKPIHLTKGDESDSIPDISDMYIDIGAKNEDDALKYVNYGDSVIFDSDFHINDFTIRSKAVDDRFGCLVLINMIKSELEYDMEFAFVVQEEVGLRGAKVASYTLDPDYAIVVETTTAADIPEIEAGKQVCNLGNGAVISVMDRSTIYDKEMVNFAFDIAKSNSISVQYKRAIAGGNDSGAIHQSRDGVRTLAISLPCRYLHAPNCVANINDCESVMKLTNKLANEIAGGILTKGIVR